MTSGGGCRACLFFGLAWIAGVAVLAVLNQPYVPLDMSPGDPGTQAALEAATIRHRLAYVLVALAPPLAAWLVARAAAGRRR